MFFDQAYGEVFWFGGRVTALTFISFIFMVFFRHPRRIYTTDRWEGFIIDNSSMVWPRQRLSWLDLCHRQCCQYRSASDKGKSSRIKYWLHLDVLQLYYKRSLREFIKPCWIGTKIRTQQVLTMRKKIKATGFSDWDSMFYNNLLSIPILAVFSFIIEDWGSENLSRNLSVHNLLLRHREAETTSINSPQETRNFLLFSICFSGAAAVGISYTTAWCVRTTSSTTYR